MNESREMHQLNLVNISSESTDPILSSEWDDEAYVSLHLVQEMLNLAGLPCHGKYSHWIPQYRIKFANIDSLGKLKVVEKKVDFLIEDHSRYINFLIEVKSAKSRITDEARLQLEDYLRFAKMKLGFLIDPYLVEAYKFNDGKINKVSEFKIQDPRNINPVAHFLRNFMERIKMRTIAIYTSKGGVGKTTLAVNLAYELAKRGQRVLVIDLDDQANASLSLGVNKAEEFEKATTLNEFEQLLDSFAKRKELIDFLEDYDEPSEFDKSKYIYSTEFNQIIGYNGCLGKIDVLPSSHRTKEGRVAGQSGIPHKRLDKALRQSGVVNDYDYIIIDTPPTSFITTMNGLFAAEYAIIPSQLEYLSAHGIRTPILRLREVQEETDNKRGKLVGVVPMMTESVNLHETVKQLIKKRFPDVALLTDISRTIRVGQASHARKPVALYAQNVKSAAKPARQFSALTDEIIDRIDKMENSLEV